MKTTNEPIIKSRQLRSDDDIQRVRDLIIETFPLTPPGFNWEVRRWEGMRYYSSTSELDPNLQKHVRLWETSDGKLVGAAHPEGPSDVHLEIHPAYRHYIEEDMLAWAEENLVGDYKDNTKRLVAFGFEYDRPRLNLFKKRNYEKLDASGVFYFLRFGLDPIIVPEIPEGYVIRETRPGNRNDALRMADLLNAAFKRDIHNAEEFLVFTKLARCFRHDMDLIAEAPDGSFACYVGLPYDEPNHYAIFEPVCTHPNHLKRGLARTLMLEALRRAKNIGAKYASTETGSAMAANRLYESIGFTETHKLQIWQKVFTAQD